jgi:hypothetical protein
MKTKIFFGPTFFITGAVVITFSFLRIYIYEKINLNWDAGILLDGAWRISNNQAVHSDFSSPFGPLAFFPVSLGFLTGETSLFNANIGIALWAVAFSLFTYWASAQVTSAWISSLLTITNALILLTPRMMNYNTDNFAYTGWYVNWGIALINLVVVVLWSQSSETKQSNSQRKIRALVFSIALVYVLFLKWTHSVPILIVGLTYLFFNSKDRKGFLKDASIFFTTAFIIMLAFTNFQLFGMISDLLLTAVSQTRSPDAIYQTVLELFSGRNAILWLMVISLFILSLKVLDRRGKISIIFLVIVLISVFTALTTSQPAEMFFGPTFALALLSEGSKEEQKLSLRRDKFQNKLKFPIHATRVTGIVLAFTIVATQWNLNAQGAILASLNKMASGGGWWCLRFWTHTP